MPVTHQAIKVGDLVRLARPHGDAERQARFVVEDINEVTDRAHIRYVCDLPIAPVEVVAISEVQSGR